MRTIAAPLLAALLLALGIAACGSDVGVGGKLVGAHCANDTMCDGRCVINNDHPNGLCTIACVNDTQCPDGSVCIDDAGGICAVLCTTVKTCTDFGPGYVCKNEDRRGTGGQIPVCEVD